LKKLLAQHNIKWIGSFFHVLYLTMPMFGLVAYSMSAMTLYTVGFPYVKDSIPWLSLPVYFGFILITCVCILLVFNSIVNKSYLSAHNQQTETELDKVVADLDKIKKHLGIKE